MQALRDGYYPIILGGDNCQTVGSAKALKMFSPNTKTLWIDSVIDINLDGKSHQDFCALELQTGISFKNQMLYSREL